MKSRRALEDRASHAWAPACAGATRVMQPRRVFACARTTRADQHNARPFLSGIRSGARKTQADLQNACPLLGVIPACAGMTPLASRHSAALPLCRSFQLVCQPVTASPRRRPGPKSSAPPALI